MPLTITHSQAADGTFSTDGATYWNADHTVTGALGVANGGTGLTTGTSGGVLYYSAAGTLASSGVLTSGRVVLGGGAGAAPNDSANLTFDGTSLTAGGYITTGTYRAGATGGTMAFSTTAGAGPTIAAGTATTDVNALNVTQTWDAAGVTFTSHKHVITNTASATASKAFEYLLGVNSLLALRKDGALMFARGDGSGNPPALKYSNLNTLDLLSSEDTVAIRFNVHPGNEILTLSSGLGLAWGAGSASGVADVGIDRNAAGVLEVNSSTAGAFRDLRLRDIVTNRQIRSDGTAPAVGGSCGTGPTIAGTDNAGKVTTGTGSPTSCTVTFATAWASAPACTVTNETTANLARATSTTTTVTLAGTLVAADVLAYICIGKS